MSAANVTKNHVFSVSGALAPRLLQQLGQPLIDLPVSAGLRVVRLVFGQSEVEKGQRPDVDCVAVMQQRLEFSGNVANNQPSLILRFQQFDERRCLVVTVAAPLCHLCAPLF